MDFVAIDVETANHDRASICAIGICAFSKGKFQGSTLHLVDPGGPFEPYLTKIHGITPELVAGEPKIRDVLPKLAKDLRGKTVAHHTGFDRQAFDRAADRCGRPRLDCKWLDTEEVARHAWPALDRRGYNLAALADRLGIAFRHHDPCEDARASGLILVAACRASGLRLEEWQSRFSPAPSSEEKEGSWLDLALRLARTPAVQGFVGKWAAEGSRALFSPARGQAAALLSSFRAGERGREASPAPARAAQTVWGAKVGRSGMPGGRLAGEVVVFTGNLSFSRAEAASAAAMAGCDVADKVTKKTTILVVGEQDARVVGPTGKSIKHRRAEELVARGGKLRILGEREFRALLTKG